MFYGNATDFKTYQEARGRTIPAEWTDEVIEVALLVASEWLDKMYYERFFGQQTEGFEQERQWPRINAVTNTFPQHVYGDTDIPQRVIRATYEAAFREANSQGALNVDFTPNKYNKVMVDDAVTVEYAQNLTINSAQVQIREISGLISPLLDPTKRGNSSSLSGDSSRV